MKVVNSIRARYDEQREQYEALQKNVNQRMQKIPGSWYYKSRIKSLESYALKLEGGRLDPSNPDDLFACMIIVPDPKSISEAVSFAKSQFTVLSRKPKCDLFTPKASGMFRFDDLRLYAQLKKEEFMPPDHEGSMPSEMIFEIQIRTFMQHGWDEAIHGLTYKGKEISYMMERIAYQVKAMLEHVEMVIYNICEIKDKIRLPATNPEVEDLKRIKKFLETSWKPDMLPNDMITTSRGVKRLIEELDVNIAEVRQYVREETAARRGTEILDLSPFFIILQSIINRAPEKIRDFMSGNDTGYRIPLPPEVDLGAIEPVGSKIRVVPGAQARGPEPGSK